MCVCVCVCVCTCVSGLQIQFTIADIHSNILFCLICMNKRVIRAYACVVDVVYDVTLGFKKGEPSLLGVLNAESCEIDVLVRLV